MDSQELMELVERRERIHPFYNEKYEHAEEPGGMYDWLFWFVVIGVPVCAVLLLFSWLLELRGI